MGAGLATTLEGTKSYAFTGPGISGAWAECLALEVVALCAASETEMDGDKNETIGSGLPKTVQQQ